MIIKNSAGQYPPATCRKCGVTEEQDYMSLQDFGNYEIEFAHDDKSERCQPRMVEYTDGSHGHIDNHGILNDCDIDQVNVLLQQEDRVSVAISSFAANTGALMLLLFIGMMLAFSLGTPDPRVTGWMSNDAPVMTEVTR